MQDHQLYARILGLTAPWQVSGVAMDDRTATIEVKSTRRPRLSDAGGLRAFRAEHPERSRAGQLLHCGERTEWLADGILAAPWWQVI